LFVVTALSLSAVGISDLRVSADAPPANLTLNKGDHICIVGGTMAERMQHFGWLEARLHSRFPQHELVFRNLAYSGDEIDGWENANHRMRSMSFGSQDEWLSGSSPCPQPTKLSPRDAGKVRENRFELTNTRADVIFAFYGYNESWAGEAGLPKFKENVDAFIKHTLAQKYNGKSAPRLVLFSPIAQEFINDANLPGKTEVAASNARLKMYSAAMREVAKANGVQFVDIFESTAGEREPGKSLTINGIHQNELGDSLIAAAAEIGLFPDGPMIKRDAAALERLRGTVNHKNFYWFNRYRVTDGYSTYGDRAFLKFAEGPGGYGDGLSNYSVGQRELEVLDVLTSNRDQFVWTVAQGRQPKDVDNSNIPEFIPVISNKPGELPGGKHKFLSGQEAIEKMTVGKGLKVELFADESMFPELVNPVQMAFDTRGRLWVAAWRTYPHWKPTDPMNDKLLILEDTDGDGRADVCKTFAGDIHNPTGFEFWNGGVIVAQGPDILFLKDTDGDDKYDVKERILHGLDTADTHHTSNSFVLDGGGALYFQEGTFHHTQVETPWGPPRRVANGAVFRYEPRTRKFDVYVSFGFANPHGHAFDAWGQDIVVDGTGANPFHGPLFSSHLDFPHKHNRPPQVYQQRTRPCPAIEVLSSSHFPEEFRGNLLVPNVIGFQGILRYKMEDKDSSLGATELEPILFSSDPNFRPADVEVGPDGAIYFTDWQNPIIGHMQHNLRDPNRDQEHGRVYRVTHEGRSLVKPVPVAGQPVAKLIELLAHPDDRVRYRARIELSARPTTDVLKEAGASSAFGGNRLPAEPNVAEHFALELLWVFQHHNSPSLELLNACLTSKEPKARAAAVRVVAAWRDDLLRLPSSAAGSQAIELSHRKAIELLLRAAADESPRVRLMAIWAASFIPRPEAYEVLLVAADYPTDQYIDFLSKEVLRTLQPLVDKAKADKQSLAFSTEAGARYLLKNMPTDQLLKQERTKSVCLEMLYRPGLQDAQRRDAVRALAKLDNKSELRVVMDAIGNLDSKDQSADTTVVFDLVRQLTGRPPAELAAARAELEKLASTAKQPIFRQIGFVSLINVDGNIDAAWKLAVTNAGRLIDFVNAMPLISDPGIRATLYTKVEPLLVDLPKELASPKDRGTVGRFVRIELPRRGTLTLAEVEVFSGDTNVARKGRASQKNTAHGGDAAKAIDGGTGGIYGMNTQTHTEENTGNPWWEVDLGDEFPIDRIVVWNRSEGDLGKRLDGFTVRVLDARRGEVWKQEKTPAPARNVALTTEGGGKAIQVRRAAMNALTYVRGQEPKTFATLSTFVKDDVDRISAIRALQRLPRATWPKEEAPALVDVLLASIQKLPAAERTSPAALDQFEFADALATLLPADRAKKVRATLGELGVRVIRLGTVFERMAFDKDVLVLQAGKPVEFLFENTDLMPHNFVITQPGSLEEIGLAAESTATDPAAAERQYVPPSNKVMLASRLLQPRESQKLSFTAPMATGVYPYVCTYPGHWRRMFGAMYVVENLDDYLANPDAHLAAHTLPIKDELLKDRRPRIEWNYEDLAAVADQLTKRAGTDSDHHSPSFANGKHLFEVASCVACHRLNGAGNEFGPDLAKLEPKFTSTEILRELLEPSARINEKYQTFLFELDSGKILTGIVLEETPQMVKIIENPLAKAEPMILKPAEITARQKSPTSIMPKGLLDKLTRDEILDLVAYITARGNREHEIFSGEHKHGAGH
jgi:putative heme-binding domain-containing protein